MITWSILTVRADSPFATCGNKCSPPHLYASHCQFCVSRQMTMFSNHAHIPWRQPHRISIIHQLRHSSIHQLRQSFLLHQTAPPPGIDNASFSSSHYAGDSSSYSNTCRRCTLSNCQRVTLTASLFSLCNPPEQSSPRVLRVPRACRPPRRYETLSGEGVMICSK